MSVGTLANKGRLDTKLVHVRTPGKSPLRFLRVPGLGHFTFTRDHQAQVLPNDLALTTNLTAHHKDSDGNTKAVHDLGPGLTTQALALALANEPFAAANAAVLAQLKYMASGTGVTAAAATDFQLQTSAGPVSSSVTPTWGATADNATLQWVGTINYVSSLAITEWALFAGTGTIGSLYNTSSDAFTASTATPTSSPAWTVNTWAGMYVAVVGATPVFGPISSNTATALTVPAWVNDTSGGGVGTTPSSNTALNIYPLMADHKVFSAINVVSGDSIQFTYTLTENSGG